MVRVSASFFRFMVERMRKTAQDSNLGIEGTAITVEDNKSRHRRNSVITQSRRGSLASQSRQDTIGSLSRQGSTVLAFPGLHRSSASCLIQETAAAENGEVSPVADARPERQNLAYWNEAESLFSSFKHRSFRSRRRGSYVFLSDEPNQKPSEKSGSYKYLQALILAPKAESGPGEEKARNKVKLGRSEYLKSGDSVGRSGPKQDSTINAGGHDARLPTSNSSMHSANRRREVTAFSGDNSSPSEPHNLHNLAVSIHPVYCQERGCTMLQSFYKSIKKQRVLRVA